MPLFPDPLTVERILKSRPQILERYREYSTETSQNNPDLRLPLVARILGHKDENFAPYIAMNILRLEINADNLTTPEERKKMTSIYQHAASIESLADPVALPLSTFFFFRHHPKYWFPIVGSKWIIPEHLQYLHKTPWASAGVHSLRLLLYFSLCKQVTKAVLFAYANSRVIRDFWEDRELRPWYEHMVRAVAQSRRGVVGGQSGGGGVPSRTPPPPLVSPPSSAGSEEPEWSYSQETPSTPPRAPPSRSEPPPATNPTSSPWGSDIASSMGGGGHVDDASPIARSRRDEDETPPSGRGSRPPSSRWGRQDAEKPPTSWEEIRKRHQSGAAPAQPTHESGDMGGDHSYSDSDKGRVQKDFDAMLEAERKGGGGGSGGGGEWR